MCSRGQGTTGVTAAAKGQELVRSESPAGAKEGAPRLPRQFSQMRAHRAEGGREPNDCQILHAAA